MKLTYKIYSLGCKVNQYDSKKLEEQLNQAHFCFEKKNANLAIVNTCSVTKSAITKDRQMLTRAKKENPEAKIVLMGCFPKIYEKDINKKELGIDIVWKVGDSEGLVKKIKKLFNVEEKNILHSKTLNILNTDKARYFLKVQDGCEQFCAYCIIPYTRGKLRSMSVKNIIREAKKATEVGYREIVLSGIHLGLFGINNIDKIKEEDINLTGLLKELVKIKDLEKIRLSSIEITEVTDELIGFMKESKKMCAHLHISLQSGCDKTLKQMNRPYTIKYFKDRVAKLRKAIPAIAVSTDVIVGFPGETKKDFEITKKFIEKTEFSRLHVFSFSAHEKTPAYLMPNKVDIKEIKSRSKILRELSKTLEQQYRAKNKKK